MTAGVLACVCACGLNKQERLTVRRWLICDDCLAAELDSAVAIGVDAVPALARALAGPPRRNREDLRRQLAASYAQVVELTAPDTVREPEVEYVNRFLANFLATYQTRSAIALQRIGTPAVFRLLREALGLTQKRAYRGDVVRVIGTTLGAIAAIRAGDTQTVPRDSLVPVRPSIFVRDTTGTPLRKVRVTFTVDSGGGTVIGSVQTTNAQGLATVGGWRLGPAPGRNVLGATAAGTIVRFMATAQ